MEGITPVPSVVPGTKLVKNIYLLNKFAMEYFWQVINVTDRYGY